MRARSRSTLCLSTALATALLACALPAPARADIVAAELRGRTAQVSVKFRSQLVTATRGKDGAVIEGSADKVTEVNDSWTFARDISSRDPNWKLVASEPGQ